MFRLSVSTFVIFVAFFYETTAKSRFVRQVQQGSSSPNLTFIDFTNQTANPIYPPSDDSLLPQQQQQQQLGSEGSGDQEGSGNLMFESSDATNSNNSPNEFVQSINLTDSDVETLVIKVHLPSRNPSDLLDDLKDQSSQQTNLPDNLDMAVSLTSLLNEVLGRIQGSSTD